MEMSFPQSVQAVTLPQAGTCRARQVPHHMLLYTEALLDHLYKTDTILISIL
jgi:hypothetical protein